MLVFAPGDSHEGDGNHTHYEMHCDGDIPAAQSGPFHFWTAMAVGKLFLSCYNILFPEFLSLDSSSALWHCFHTFEASHCWIGWITTHCGP